MKKLIILSFLLLAIEILFAEPIDKETAQKVATNFMNNKRGVENEVKNIISEDYNQFTCYYVVNFKSGGWAMVSSIKAAVPVLCYCLDGEYKTEDEKPDAFVAFTDEYKKKIEKSKSKKSADKQLQKKWEKLLNGSSLKSATYSPGDQLLDVPNRGHVQWSQDQNNSGGCTPSYNSYCPSASCGCGHKRTGCGAVAMGQIMWYWKWPLQSTIRAYDWDIMPYKLTNSSSTEEGNAIAQLLNDCGDAADKGYWFCNTFTMVNDIEDAFKGNFKYNAAYRHVKSNWSYDAWCDLIRSEIDNNRPVLYRGDKQDILEEKHEFVIDGYASNDPDYFSINFGWGWPGYSYNISFWYLNNIVPGDYDFNENQMAVVGISPTYTSNVNITDVSYSSVSDVKFEDAQQNISLPASGKSLTVLSGGNLTFTAGNSIKLNPGFKVNSGGRFKAQINPVYSEVVDITVPTWYNGFSPNGDGINDEFILYVNNADSWEFEAFDWEGRPVFQSAGTISGNVATLWDGTGKYYVGSYPCIVRFKNSFGRYEEKAYYVYLSY